MFKVLDLFSGIGAYSLGLERTGGFETVAFCEINAFCRRILNKHWPHVPAFEDVTTLTGAGLRAAGIVPDWIVAGWPCQDISSAGTGAGLDGARSGLWAEVARLAGELRPRGLLLENSSNLLGINGGADFGRVLGDLAALGYDAEWHCLPAAAFDAPHIRDRLWIVATLADAERVRQPGPRKSRDAGDTAAHREGEANRAEHGRQDVADAESHGRRPRLCEARPILDGAQPSDGGGAVADANGYAPVGTAVARLERHSWQPEPDVGRVVAGCPDRVERLRALGNLNPPIVPETIGRAILAAEADRLAA